MKSLIVSIGLLAAVFVGSAAYNKRIDSISNELKEHNKEVCRLIEYNNYDEADKKLIELKEYMNSKTQTIEAMGNHSDIDNINISIAELEQYIKEKNRGESLVKCNVLNVLIEHLTESYHLKIENIL